MGCFALFCVEDSNEIGCLVVLCSNKTSLLAFSDDNSGTRCPDDESWLGYSDADTVRVVRGKKLMMSVLHNESIRWHIVGAHQKPVREVLVYGGLWDLHVESYRAATGAKTHKPP